VYTYFRCSQLEPVRRESDLIGRHVLLQRGDMMDDYLSESRFGRKITRLDDMRQILRELNSGRADYALIERRTGRELVRELGFSDITDLGSMHYIKDLCFGSGLKQDVLIRRINHALHQTKADGRYQALWKKWFGGDPAEVDIPENHAPPWAVMTILGGFLLLIFISLTAILYQRSSDIQEELGGRIRDLETSRKEIQESRARLRVLFSNALAAIVLLDADGKIIEANERFFTLTGLTAETMNSENGFAFPRGSESGRPEQYHITKNIIRRDGTGFWGEILIHPLLASEGIPGGFVAVMVDVDEYKKAEIALRVSETRYRRLTESAPDLIYRLSLPSGTYEYVNPAAFRITGCTPDEFYATPFLLQHLIPEDHQEIYQRHLERLQKGMAEPFIEYPMLHREGTIRWLQDRSIPSIDPSGRMIGAEGIIRDITYPRRVAEELRRSEANMRAMFHSTKDGYVLVDCFGTMVACNPPGAAWLAALGRTAGSSTSSLRMDPPPAAWSTISADLDTAVAGTPMTRTLAIPRANGGQDHLEINLWPVPDPGHGSHGVCLHLVDVTERERISAERRVLDEKVRKTQKYESLGILAGGIAHDFNNLLTGILGAADLARRQVQSESMLEGYIDRVIATARRAAELTQQMLAYSGKGTLVLQTVDLAATIREMANLLEASIPKKCRLQFEFASGLPPAVVDLAQMRQVLINLVVNAAEAIGDRTGTITIRTGRMNCAAESLAEIGHGQTPEPGDYVFIDVLDEGGGMDANTQAHLFEPFFSTKFTGRGLGLAAVLGIVQSLHGAIRVESQPGHGSRFSVLLPAAMEVGTAAEAQELPPAIISGKARGLILVVDDEEFIRSLAGEMLKAAGYSVEMACDGIEAISLVRRQPEAFSVVLLDLTMPGMDGTEAFAEIRKLAPSLPIIISSGYSEANTSSEALAGRAGFLHKPYTSSDLLVCIGSVMGDFSKS